MIRIGLAVAGLLMASQADAALVTWRASGTVTDVQNEAGWVANAPSPGTDFHVDYTFDDATLPRVVGRTSNYDQAMVSMTFAADNGFSMPLVSAPTGVNSGIAIQDQDALPFERFFQAFMAGPTSQPAGSLSMFIYLFSYRDIRDDPLSGASIPATPPDPADFNIESSFLLHYFDGSRDLSIEGSLWLNEVAPAPVPLPAAAWLLLSGLGGLAAFARRPRSVTGIVSDRC